MTALMLVDWALDATALLISIYFASILLDLSTTDIAMVVSCFSVYAAHEAWEANILLAHTHHQFEQWLVTWLTLL